MSYYDPETHATFEKGPSDFIDSNNVKYIYKGNVQTLNPNFDQGKYDREHAAWEAYKHQQTDVVQFDVHDDVPDGTDHHFDPLTLDPPPVPGGADHPGRNVTTVNTDAIKLFATNLSKLDAPLQAARAELDDVDIRAGGFHEAFTLRDKIMGDKGLVVATQQFIDQTRRMLAHISEAADKMVLIYNNTDAFNKMTADQLKEQMIHVNADYNALNGH